MKKVRWTVKTELIFMVLIPAILVAAGTCLCGYLRLQEGILTQIEHSLQIAATSMQDVYKEIEGDWKIEDDVLYKGKVEISGNYDVLTASMEELNATINMMSEAANSLRMMADDLTWNIGFFK